MPYWYWSCVFTWRCFLTSTSGSSLSHFGMWVLVFYFKFVSKWQSTNRDSSVTKVTGYILNCRGDFSCGYQYRRRLESTHHGATVPSGLGLHGHTQIHHTRQDFSAQVISPSQRPLPYNTQHSKGQTSMPPSGFEPAVPASERPKTHPLDRAATGIGAHPPIWRVFGLRWQEREASLSDS